MNLIPSQPPSNCSLASSPASISTPLSPMSSLDDKRQVYSMKPRILTDSVTSDGEGFWEDSQIQTQDELVYVFSTE